MAVKRKVALTCGNTVLCCSASWAVLCSQRRSRRFESAHLHHRSPGHGRFPSSGRWARIGRSGGGRRAGPLRERGQGAWELRPTPAAVPLTGRKRHKSSRLRARSREAEKGRRLRHRVRDVGRGGQGHARLVDRAMDRHPPPELVASERGDRRQLAYYSIPCSPWKLARLHTANLGAF